MCLRLINSDKAGGADKGISKYDYKLCNARSYLRKFVWATINNKLKGFQLIGSAYFQRFGADKSSNVFGHFPDSPVL